jgi:hypothetical protein
MMLIRSGQLVGGVALLAWAVVVGGCNEDSATDASGRLVDPIVLGETGTHPGQFVYPRAMDVYVERQTAIAVVIDKTARMQTIDLSTGEQIGEVLMPIFDRGMPTGVSVGVHLYERDQLAAYVADTHEHRVLMYGLPLDGSGPDFEFGVYGEGEGEFIYPTDVIVRADDDGAKELLISEYGGNDRVSRYLVERDGDGVQLIWNGQIGTASETVDGSDGEVALSRPQSIGLWLNDGVEELVVVDSAHHRVGRIGMDGELIAWYESDHDPEFAPMQFPYGVRVLEDGSALISEFGGNVVRRMDLLSGMTMEMFGVAGRGDGELATPWTSVVIGGELVILDSGNNRIQKVRFDASERVAGGQR